MVSEASLPIKHCPWPKEGDHLYSNWMPFDKKHEYRMCMHPECHYYEKREAKG